METPQISTETNPNKVNQYTNPDPRQNRFWALYIDPESETFSNAYQSAVKAGFTHQSALSITKTKWFSESPRIDEEMIIGAKNNLMRYLQMETEKPAYTMFGKPIKDENGNPVMRDLNKRIEAQVELTKFVLERKGGWVKTDKLVGKHLLFSLADLRRAAEAKKAREAETKAISANSSGNEAVS